ncbi:MAG: hypothetical protein JO358_16455 [Alphaproteobacteria bacterium]|nr:hypothetical protein [Alphaproteobacteria bacterium]
MREAVGGFRQCISEAAARHDGFVFSSLGNTVLALFGYPTAHENGAEHAVLAGLELCISVRALRTHADLPTRCRVGIETGTVIVGDRVGEHRDQMVADLDRAEISVIEQTADKAPCRWRPGRYCAPAPSKAGSRHCAGLR